MAYLEEFSNSINTRDYIKVTELWQEYCESDEADPEEISSILSIIKQSEMARRFGTIIEQILPLVMTIQDDKQKMICLAAIFDIQTTNSDQLFDLAHEIIKGKFSDDPKLQEKLRLVGLRTKGDFQGAISNFLLLNHIKKGNFVLHSAGWGVGEIIDFSFLREQISIEFENLGGSKRDISFKNAYKSLVPLKSNHVLSLRYAHPDLLGKMAIQDPVGLVIQILNDLGPQTALDIKDFLSGTVIDDGSYSKWWQSTRGKIKKDSRIEAPENTKDRYSIRKGTITLEERVSKALHNKRTFHEIVSAIYSLLRDFPQILKETSIQIKLKERIQSLLSSTELKPIEKLQALFVLETIEENSPTSSYSNQIQSIVTSIDDYLNALHSIEILAFRKRLLIAMRSLPNWIHLFAELLLAIEPLQLKDYLLKELSTTSEGKKEISKKIQFLVEHPVRYPETFLWYFQKVIDKSANSQICPFDSDQEALERFFEAFLLLYSAIEFRNDMKDLVKKMYGLLTGDRYKIVRDLLKDTDLAYAREFLLLASKCQSLTDHDQKILRSLAGVVHSSITSQDKDESLEQDHILWTTEDSYQKMKERIHHIGTVEIVENAREIEEARKLGDLRENSEYKFALERRSRLQKDLKALSDQFQKARIITPDDVTTDTVGIGTRVEVVNSQGQKIVYTILGPWDANSEEHILSIESKVAQALLDKKVKDSIDLRGEKVTILSINSVFQ